MSEKRGPSKETESQEAEPIGIPFVIAGTPICFWDFHHSERQSQFLESIDPTYFEYQGRIHAAQLDGDDAQQAAVSLRMTYSHALESLFALICVAVQAPLCPAGWLLKYKNSDLKEMLKGISDRDHVLNKLGLDRPSWADIATKLAPWSLPDQAHVELREATGRLWEALAIEYLHPDFEDEYNSLKHGFRVRPGGYYLAMGIEDVPGIHATPERMRLMGRSDYGTWFLRPVPLKKHHWSFEDQRVNWDPSRFANRLPLVANSMTNVLAFLRVANGGPPETIAVTHITNESVDEALKSNSHGMIVKPVPPRILSEWIPNVSASDILDMYAEVPDPDDC